MLETEDSKFVGFWMGLLGLLDVSLKLKMSLLRTGGAVGEGDPTSAFEKMHVVQLLTVEKTSTLMGLTILHWLKARSEERKKMSKVVKSAIVAGVVCAYVFLGRAFDKKVNAHGYSVAGGPGNGELSVFGAVGATGGYIAQYVLSGALIL